MAVPLFIRECVRKNGRTMMVVTGHGLTVANVGNQITVMGVSDRSVNVVSTISRVVPPDTIEFAQPGLPDICMSLTGGAVAIGA